MTVKVPHPRGLQTQVDAQERGVVVILQTSNFDGEMYREFVYPQWLM